MRVVPLVFSSLLVLLAANNTTAQTTTPPAADQGTPAQQQPAPDKNSAGKPITDTLTYTVDPNAPPPAAAPAAPAQPAAAPVASPQPMSESSPEALHAPEPPPTKAERRAALAARHPAFDDRYHFAVLATIGTAGAGIQFGIPVVPHVALRLGGEYIRYTGSYQYDSANIGASLQFGYGRASLDLFPWKNRRFHISPLVVFANQTHVQANVTFASTTTFDFEGQQFYSSPADPLHGTGRVDLRKTSPGVTVGFGNLTHGRGHWTFPVEMGFFYNGQPAQQIDFSGTVCVVGQPTAYACEKVQDQAEFQKDLASFKARQMHNLSYAKFIPVFNFGVGYRF